MTEHATDPIRLSTSVRSDEGYVVTADGARIRYLKAGTGALTVVLIPGWTMHLESFEHQLRHLAADPNITVIAFDPRSHGKSSMTSEGNYYEQHAQDLRDVLDQLGVSSCVLVGWSAGSADIIEYLRTFGPSAVQGVVLIDISPASRGRDFTAEWVEYGTKENGDQDGQLRYFCHDLLVDRGSVTREFCAWMLENPTPDAVDFFARMSLTTPTGIAAQLNMSYWFVDGAEQIESLDGDVPMMFVVRDEKGQLAQEWATEHCPSAQVEVFGRHAMFWEQPDRFNTVLDSFLAGVTAHHAGQPIK